MQEGASASGADGAGIALPREHPLSSSGLTPTERRIVALVAEGMTNRESPPAST